MSLPETIQEKLAALEADNVHGAKTLATDAADLLADLVAQSDAPSAKALTDQLVAAAQAVVEAQPTMAPLFNLANQTLLRIESLTEREAVAEAVREETRRFKQQMAQAGQTIAQHAAALVAPHSTIFTHSASGTVRQTFEQLHQTGLPFQVICTESRPVNEGIELAQALAEMGVPVTLVVDAAAWQMLSAVDLVFVGADALSAEGLVNKTGTAGLALAAQRHGRRCYALCSRAKILPAGRTLPAEPPKNPAEILETSLAQLTVKNYYFDTTPLSLLTGVITEAGVLSVAEIERQFEDSRIHPALQSPA